MPTFPALDFTRLDISKIRLPKVDLPTGDAERVVGFARDAAYVGIGLAVLGFQQAQVRRRHLIDVVKDRVS